MSSRFCTRLAQKRVYVCSECLHRQSTRQPSRRAFHTSPRININSPRNVLPLLEERGYINQLAGDRNVLSSLLSNKKVSFYAGVDPTAPSLHLGHLLPIMVLFWVSVYGHHAVSLVGGGTARVGDPSGRLTARVQTTDSTQRDNADAMLDQTRRLWDSARMYAQRHGREMSESRLLDNGEWLDQLNVLDFLKTLGNGMRVGAMLGRDTVKNKMEKGDGMSFSEFTYPLLQAWDWWHMYSTMDVQVQIGGSDQYGNIVAGMDAVKYIAQNQDSTTRSARWLDGNGRLRAERAPMGVTVPLLTTVSGEKFGKSAGNAIWLNREMTSPFDLYGFLLRSSDTDVERYLKLFTFVPTDVIQLVMSEHTADPGKRKAQHLLASEVLELVHGRKEAERTRNEHQAMRSPSLASLNTQPADQTASPNDSAERVALQRSDVLGAPLSRVLHHAGLASTKSAGARLVADGGLYIASRPVDVQEDELIFTQMKDPLAKVEEALLVDGLLVLRLGKWKVRVIEVV